MSKWYYFNLKFSPTTGSHHEKNASPIRGCGRPLRIPAWAKTYYVDAKYGSDYNTGLKESQAMRTIQAAIDKAAAGSTILVAPGTYAPFRTSKKLTIKSTGGAEDTVVDGSLAEKYTPPTVNVPSWVQVSYKWEYNPKTEQYEKTDKVESYYYYDGNGEYHDWFPPVDESIWDFPYPKEKTSKNKYGKEVYRMGETRFSGACAVLGKLNYRVGVSYSTDGCECQFRGKWLDSVAASISGFTLRSARYGILGGSASYCVISGISEVAAGMSSLTDSEICGNELRYVESGCSGAIASASTLNRCLIHDNTLQDNVGVGSTLILEGYDATLQSYDNAGGWISRASWLSNCLVFSNSVPESYGCWSYPFVSVDVYNCTIADNVLVSGCAAIGISCWNEYGNVYNSIVWGNIDSNGKPANVKKVHDEITGRTVAADYMNYNSSWNGEPWVYKPRVSMMNSLTDIPIEQKGNGKGYMISGGWSDYDPIWTYKVTCKNSTGNIAADPCFIDPDNGDYHLAPWSPCIDMGADYQSKTGKFDLDSAARKVGKVDMGAYELQPREAVPPTTTATASPTQPSSSPRRGCGACSGVPMAGPDRTVSGTRASRPARRTTTRLGLPCPPGSRLRPRRRSSSA